MSSRGALLLPRIITLLLIMLAFAATIVVYPELPSEMASHWNAAGEADGFSAKGLSTFFVPILMVGLAGLMWAVPFIDPLRKNVEVFRLEYEWFIAVMTAFFLVIQAQILLWNLGYEISPNVVLPISMSVLYIYIGWMLGRARRNFFIGIRTPWTLMSEEVWDKTHRLGGILFIMAGVITLLGALMPEYSVWFTLVPVLIATAVTVVYSYVLYQRVGPDKGPGEQVIPPAP